MRITIVGGGSIGRALMQALAARHELTLGARDPEGGSAAAVREQFGDRVAVRRLADALQDADAIVLAIPGGQVTAFIEQHGAPLAGRLVIDATNDRQADGGLNHIADWQRLAPGVDLARAFCTLGWENITEPSYDGVAATMFWCGPDGEQGERVAQIVIDTGLDPVRIGGIDAADTLDGVTRLWFQLAFAQGMGRRLGVRLLRG
jgi:predicted dinucleotide-binding enzyme